METKLVDTMKILQRLHESLTVRWDEIRVRYDLYCTGSGVGKGNLRPSSTAKRYICPYLLAIEEDLTPVAAGLRKSLETV